MNLLGFFSHKESSCCLVADRRLLAHVEWERHHRVKEAAGPAVKYAAETLLPKFGMKPSDIDFFPTIYRSSYLAPYGDLPYMPSEKARLFAHHRAHCADAFFGSGLSDALIISLDGGGWESDEFLAGAVVYFGRQNSLTPLANFAASEHLPGSVWGRVTRYVFRESVGPPLGHKAGTIMAMSAFGDGARFKQKFYDALTTKLAEATWCPPGHAQFKERNESIIDSTALDLSKNEPHPYWDELTALADRDEQARFDLAASLQAATEQYLREFISKTISLAQKNGLESNQLCITGGTALNSVAIGKVKDWFPNLDVFVPPIPYDTGLCLGAAHLFLLDETGDPHFERGPLPFYGLPRSAQDQIAAVEHDSARLTSHESSLENVAELLKQNKIIAVYHGRSESGRRALGHRSILASPISPEMKAMINEKVKHRQWFRPFAPAILHEFGPAWFENYQFSPTMTMCLKFKEEVRDRAPAVVHHDGTGRLQSVTADNDLMYPLLGYFHSLTGVPILLNTSFNDREPIVETPEHAINCFLKTDIDYLYFSEAGLLVEKRR